MRRQELPIQLPPLPATDAFEVWFVDEEKKINNNITIKYMHALLMTHQQNARISMHFDMLILCIALHVCMRESE